MGLLVALSINLYETVMVAWADVVDKESPSIAKDRVDGLTLRLTLY